MDHPLWNIHIWIIQVGTLTYPRHSESSGLQRFGSKSGCIEHPESTTLTTNPGDLLPEIQKSMYQVTCTTSVCIF